VSGDAALGERNHLLRLLAAESPDAHAAFVAGAERVELVHGAVLYAPHAPIAHAYFPQSAVCSIFMPMRDGRDVEVATVGHEGMVGLALFLAGVASPTLCVAQIPGEAVRVPADAFRAAAAPGGPLHSVMQRFAHYLFDQTAQTAGCNRLHPLEQRCARWLCMTHDRVGDSRFELTQEFLARMLGVRRAGVTVAAGHLQDAGHIRYRRGVVRVLDRAGLEAASCECYQADRADYARLLG
jgi:CRP-like cAMP-binding protein